MSSITIRCANGEELDVDLEVAKQVPVIESALRHSSDEATSMEWPVDSATFHLIFDWCAYHKDDKEAKDGKEKEENGQEEYDLSDRDRAFLAALNPEALCKLIAAANLLRTEHLYQASCQTMANLIKGKTPEQIRERFNQRNDFTPNELKEIEENNRWFKKPY